MKTSHLTSFSARKVFALCYGHELRSLDATKRFPLLFSFYPFPTSYPRWLLAQPGWHGVTAAIVYDMVVAHGLIFRVEGYNSRLSVWFWNEADALEFERVFVPDRFAAAKAYHPRILTFTVCSFLFFTKNLHISKTIGLELQPRMLHVHTETL